MTDPNAINVAVDNLADLPMQPTGSGVADLEIAYEQMRLEEAERANEAVADDDAAETVAHPS